MKQKSIVIIISLFIILTSSYAQSDSVPKELLIGKGLIIDMQWFLSYTYGKDYKEEFNKFTLKRGYVNIKKDINNKFSGRITTDLTVDKEGDGKGDIEIRLKYMYLKYKLNTVGFLYKPYLEFGLVHRPWIDFEQQINKYRIQSQMFLERNEVISSADFGVVFMSMLGGELDDEYKKRVNKKFPGKYGSFSVGVFNGGGYHALENNMNKTVESRLTIRPMHKILPGLQLSYHGAIGKGNTNRNTQMYYQSGYLSYENSFAVVTGELYEGKGNYKGSFIKDTIYYAALPHKGFSAFGELKVLKSRISLIGRYDSFAEKFEPQQYTTKRYIAGIVYHFVNNSKVIIDYEYSEVENKLNSSNHIFEVAMELRF